MRNILKIIIASVGILSTSQIQASGYYDGYQALNMCQSQAANMSAGCSMFIIGVAETLRMLGSNGDKYCMARASNNVRLRNEFIKYLSSHQDSLKYSATSLFYASLIKNYPCTKKAN